MSFASYLCYGSGGPNKQYCRAQYPKDEVTSIATTNHYLGKLGTVTKVDDFREEVLIDSAIKVTCVAKKIREKAVDFWNKAKSGSFITFTAVLITGILAAGAAITVASVVPELWIVAASVGGVALVILGLSLFLLSKANSAGKQLEAWKQDPVLKAKRDRIRIGNEGFYPAFSEKLKGIIVSGLELEGLWYRDMDRYVAQFGKETQLHDATKVALVREFIRKSPLAHAPLNYTFEEVEPSIRTVNTKFESLKNNADAIRSQSKALKEKINQKKRKAMRENDSHRDQLLLPYRLMIKPRQAALEARISGLRITLACERNRFAQLSATRTHVVAPPPHTVVSHRGHVISEQRNYNVPDRRPVTQRLANPNVVAQVRLDIQRWEMELHQLERELLQVNTIYLAMTLPIKNMHARNEANIQRWAGNEIKKIEMDEDKLMQKLYPPIQDILREYATRHQKKPVVAEELKEPEGTLTMKTPPLETKYEPVKYNDSWKGVIEEFEWKQKQTELVKDQLVPSTMK